MNTLQFLTDEQGQRVAVVLPFATWEALYELPDVSNYFEHEPNAATQAAMHAVEKGSFTATSLEQLAKDWDAACEK